jgi:hypothetical protein
VQRRSGIILDAFNGRTRTLATKSTQATELSQAEQPTSPDFPLLDASHEVIPTTKASLWTRLADRTKWPRNWWWPAPKKIDLSEEDWKKQHDEISKALNKLLLVLIGFCFFCGLALGKPDRYLLASDAMIKLPFADTELSFVTFLIIAPLVLTALSFYLHFFVGYWIRLHVSDQTRLYQRYCIRSCHSFSICQTELRIGYHLFCFTGLYPSC